MKKIKEWLINNFLPVLAKAALQKENEDLKREIREANEEIRILKAYIAGFEAGGRTGKIKIINNTHGGGDK